ncbi:MAG: BlaI/MecI/CopY family transcriptional regulator [Bacteroidota bacterium]
MKKLAKREEELMQVLWKLEKAFVKEIIEEFPGKKKPHYNTVSTIIRILENKGFVSHEAFGNSHRYYPVISKEAYQSQALGDVVKNYFDNSIPKLVAYFAKEEQITPDELEEIIRLIKNKKS